MTTMNDGVPVLERIRRTLVALRMPRALELLDMPYTSSNAAKPVLSS